jgi:GDPmannose 4,6-dehydratase
VREFVELAFAEIGIAIDWQRAGVDECGLCKKTRRTLVRIDPRYFRPTEVEILLGNPAKARTKLGWKHQIGFPQLVREMVASDLKLASERFDSNLSNDRS